MDYLFNIRHLQKEQFEPSNLCNLINSTYWKYRTIAFILLFTL